MEKFSAYRDAGTGIQPFLKPVPPNAPTIFALVTSYIGVLIGIGRTTLILLIALLYFSTVEIILQPFHSFNPLHDLISWIINAFSSRLTLWVLGFWWINVSYVTKTRGRKSPKLPWAPKAGDVIISNWASWIEILWLAFRFNPIFLLPVPSEPPRRRTQVEPVITPGRRTGTGSAAITTRSPSERIPIRGYEPVSLLRMVYLSGKAPPYSGTGSNAQSLDALRANATRPFVIFPEGTTSNGRAMLKFHSASGAASIPAKSKIFVMCVRYDPPTLYTPSLTHSIPSKTFNPIGHIFALCSSISPLFYQSLTIRLLNPAESPSNDNLVVSETLAGSSPQDNILEACAILISQLGKMRITGLAWEDKVSFLDFYRSKIDK